MNSNNITLLLDLDGTLTNNTQTMYDCFEIFLLSLRLKASKVEFDKYNGVPLRIYIKYLKNKHNLHQDHDILLKNYLSILNTHYFSSPIRKDALELLNYARSKHFKIGLVTSGFKDMVERMLSQHNIMHYFDIIVCAEHVINGKPDKEPYAIAISYLSSNPARTYVVEDSLNGLISAQANGVKTCYLKPNQYKLSKLEKILSWQQVSCFQDVIEILKKIA